MIAESKRIYKSLIIPKSYCNVADINMATSKFPVVRRLIAPCTISALSVIVWTYFSLSINGGMSLQIEASKSPQSERGTPNSVKFKSETAD